LRRSVLVVFENQFVGISGRAALGAGVPLAGRVATTFAVRLATTIQVTMILLLLHSGHI